MSFRLELAADDRRHAFQLARGLLHPAFMADQVAFSGMAGQRELCLNQVMHQATPGMGASGTGAAATRLLVEQPLCCRTHLDRQAYDFKSVFI